MAGIIFGRSKAHFSKGGEWMLGHAIPNPNWDGPAGGIVRKGVGVGWARGGKMHIS